MGAKVIVFIGLYKNKYINSLGEKITISISTIIHNKMTTEIKSTLDFLSHVSKIRNAAIKNSNMNPSWVKVTTITITSKFSTSLDLQFLREFFNKRPIVGLKSQQTKYVTEWKMSPTTFYNQISIYYDDHKSRKSVKLFPNGAIQVAGCSDMPECSRVMKQIRSIVSYITKRKLTTTDFNVAMINTNFSLNSSVNLYEIFSVFNNAGYDTNYNPDRYAAVKVRIELIPGRFITVSIFGSGKVIMTGARKLSEISSTYDIIMNIIRENQYSLLVEPTTTVEMFNLYRGVPIEQWLEKIST